ncbi:HAD-IA family hydrolase [Candidatus Albibeggiatoa sp. nov. NOAA]|uniref:HAD family hydrolase n=1 Tax=Candidatus Albibeggiatoa sp. nov. NOAA TaxID=3162724 RepID=UPI0032F972FB|nr:HAD-IA family hydrolase [Thiotrichaceae bacterium]
MKIETVLFDLDGTLVDTLPDLAHAMNVVLQEQGKPIIGLEAIRPSVSHGARAMLRFALGSEDYPNFDDLHQQMLDVYAKHIADKSALFAGMEQVLQYIDQNHKGWGIVTNKHQHFTDPLLDKLQLTNRSLCNVSGDTLPESKPHPAPILHACKLADTKPENCIYIGDAKRDIEAGQRAGMQTFVALFGYLSNDDQPDTWGATGFLNQPEDLITWLQNA